MPENAPRRRNHNRGQAWLAGLAVLGLAAYQHRDTIANSLGRQNHIVTLSPEAVPSFADISYTDQTTMYALRDAHPRNETFMMNIDGITYAWPVGRPHRSLYKMFLPCDTYTDDRDDVLVRGMQPCHHDPVRQDSFAPGENWASDFAYRDQTQFDQTGHPDAMYGEPVRAISDGTILDVYIDDRHGDYCSALQFTSVDGHNYYYGHLSENIMVEIGQPISAGEQIAEVGAADCGQGMAHLHLDRGIMGERGGSEATRDPNYIPLIQTLYLSLPE